MMLTPNNNLYTSKQLQKMCGKCADTICKWQQKAQLQKKKHTGKAPLYYTRDEAIAILQVGKQHQVLYDVFGIGVDTVVDAPPLTAAQQQMVLDCLSIVHYHVNRLGVYISGGDRRAEMIAEGYYYLCWLAAKYPQHQHTDYWKKYVGKCISRHLQTTYFFDDDDTEYFDDTLVGAVKTYNLDDAIIAKDIYNALTPEQKELYIDTQAEIPSATLGEKYNIRVGTVNKRKRNLCSRIYQIAQTMQLDWAC